MSELINLYIIAEWRDHYVPYTSMIAELKELVKAVPSEIDAVSKTFAQMRHDRKINRAQQEDSEQGKGNVLAATTCTAALQGSLGEIPRDLSTLLDEQAILAATVADSVTMVRDTIRELTGVCNFDPFSAHSFDGEAMAASFSSPSTGVKKKLRMSITTLLTEDFHMCVRNVEYRAGKRLVQEECIGVSAEGVERFATFEKLERAEFEPMEPHDTNTAEHESEQQAFYVFRTIHEINCVAMTKLRHYLSKANEFYRVKSFDVSIAVFVIADLLKQKDDLSDRERDKLDRMCRRAFFTTQMLQEYCDHNYLIVTQIIDVLYNVTHQGRLPSSALDFVYFYSPANYGQVALLEQLIVHEYSAANCDGDDSVAKQRLTLHQVQERRVMSSKPLVILQIGLSVGWMLALGMACAATYGEHVSQYDHRGYSDSDLFMFSVSGIVVLLAILFAVDVVIWDFFQINYVYSLHLDPLHHFEGLPLLRDHCLYGVVWVTVLYCFVHAAMDEAIIDAKQTAGATAVAEPTHTLASWVWGYSVIPSCMVVAVVLSVVSWGQQQWFLRSLGRILVTPLLPVEFPDFLICEQLVSVASTLFESQFFWCQFHSGAVEDFCTAAKGDRFFALLVLPSFWRVLQSLRRYFDDEGNHDSFYPHLLNATKYSVSCTAYVFYALLGQASFRGWAGTSYNAMLVLFFVLTSVDTVFKNAYELWVEFGVFRRNADHWMIREKILLPQWSYYFAIVTNLLLRCIWVIKFFTEKVWTSGATWVFPLFGVAEVIRRFLWNLYRVEHDQVSNIENYKLVTFTPSMHHEAPQKALWDITADDVRKGLLKGESAFVFFANVGVFFKAVSRRERSCILSQVKDLKGDTSEKDLPNESVPQGADSSNVHFIKDPRSGLMKTSLLYFSEMFEEDRCRALLKRIGPKRTLQTYLGDLVASGDLPAQFLDSLAAVSTSSPPKHSSSAAETPLPSTAFALLSPRRSSSSRHQPRPHPNPSTMPFEDSASEPFPTLQPTQSLSRHRRGTIA